MRKTARFLADNFLKASGTKTWMIGLAIAACTAGASASSVTINDFTFDMTQFDGAKVTYRADGSVGFAGKLWDQAVGVDLYTLGELAADQAGGDPGDQVSLNDRTTPDWLKLTYATPVALTASKHHVVIYEISSYTYVDPEGTSFQIKVNGGNLIDASIADATNFWAGMVGDDKSEDCNQLAFDLFELGFSAGDLVRSFYIENKDSGSLTSDPDFIFAGVADTGSAVPEPMTMLAVSTAIAGLGGYVRRRRSA